MGLLDRLRQRWGQATIPTQPEQTLSAAIPEYAVPVSGGFAVVDVETTGLLPTRDRIVEIAVIHTDGVGRVLDEWTTLIDPCGPVGATRIHGITAADIRRAPRFADVAGEVTARLSGRALVAHNARFDLGFIQTEYARSGWDMPVAPYLCTLTASSIYLPHLARRRLTDCCWATGIALHDAHSALADARATASLLAFYLDPRRPPAREHLELPLRAARVGWPLVPQIPVTVRLRAKAVAAPAPSEPGKLAALLDNLPLSSAIEEGAPVETTAYLELLAEVLEDGVLTDAEAAALADLTRSYSLTREHVEAAHRGFLLALAHKAIEDGKVTHAEREELLTTAAILGFPDRIIKAVLDEARTAFANERGKTCKPLPNDWAYGDPLRIGQGVAFTGGDDVQRARLEGRAQAVGLRVTGSVSRKTAVLVTDGADPQTTKALAARNLGTRIITPAVFAELIDYIQPALVEPKPTSQATTPALTSQRTTAPARSASQPATLEDPATVRAWARQHGFTVGVRGRLPADALAAYRAADGHPTMTTLDRPAEGMSSRDVPSEPRPRDVL